MGRSARLYCGCLYGLPGASALKTRKYVTVFLGLIIVAAIGVYLYRDSIARKVANSVLKNSELAVTGLSIKTIGADNVSFDELVLEWSGGSRIRITGIVLPTNIRKAQPGLLQIDEIELIRAGNSDQPVSIAAILASILELPQNLPYSTVQIGRVSTAGLPPLANVSWESTDAGQLLRLDIGSFAVTTGIEPVTDSEHRVSITATTPDNVVAVALALAVERETSRFFISGQSTARMAPLLPVMHAIGMVPAKITSMDTLLWGAVNTAISDNPQEPIQVEATLQSDSGMSLEYRIDDESQMQIQIVTHAPTVTMVEYPSLDWRATVESGEMKISTASIQDFSLSVTALTCQAGIICTLQANISTRNILLGGLAIASADVSAPMAITVGEQTLVQLAETTTATFRGVKNQEMTAESIDLIRFTGATIHVDDDGWRGMSDDAHLQIEGFAAAPGLSGSMATTLSNVAISDGGATITSKYHIDATAAQLTLASLAWSVPDISGTWKIANNKFSATATLISADDAIQGKLELKHDLDTSNGEMQLRDVSIDLTSRSLSKFLSHAPQTWDANAGRLSLGADLNWTTADDDFNISGNMQLGLDDIAAFRGDVALTGLSTKLDATINTKTGHKFEPTTLSIDLLDVGLPLSEIKSEFQVGADLSSVQVDALSMSVLGGTIRTDPFNYSPQATAAAVLLRIESIQLSLMKALAEFDSIDIVGSVSGTLPITIIGDQITIDHGRLESDEPGGSIRYRAGDAAADDSQLGLATRALSDFEFESLTADVTYTEDGDLLLAMRLEGVNPKMDPTQPVVLNLKVENNVPQMLRSLQATRSIQEIFERRLNIE